MRESIRLKLEIDDADVDLQNMAISDDEISDIVTLMSELHPNAHKIFLNNNQITDKGAILLGTSFINLPHLTFIDLQFNDIGLKGADNILKLKSVHPKIIIALHGNQIVSASDINKIEEKYGSIAGFCRRKL